MANYSKNYFNVFTTQSVSEILNFLKLTTNAQSSNILFLSVVFKNLKRTPIQKFEGQFFLKNSNISHITLKKAVLIDVIPSDIVLNSDIHVVTPSTLDIFIETLKNNTLNIDFFVTTPELLPLLKPHLKFLLKNKLLPSVALGTLTSTPFSFLKNFDGELIRYKSDKSGTINVRIGSIHTPKPTILKNLFISLSNILSTKASFLGLKKVYIVLGSISIPIKIS